ncbi:hypothetical protein EZS27_010088 [termite gut metagenome]|uniref:Uncharacterized protein n=1 Tax=termite gut metagenome TaxID=433724 RepID=A0A5J4SA67_9ZZZZ
MNKENSNSKTINILHFIYVVIILALILIAVFTTFFYKENEIVHLISFAATITSIILSVLAIFITVLSNNSITGLISSISHIPPLIDKMNESSGRVIQSVDKMEEIQTDLINSSEKVKDSTRRMENTLNQKMEIITTEVKNIALSQTSRDTHEKDTGNLISNYLPFVSSLSYSGLCLLYVLYKAFHEKVEIIHLNSFSKVIPYSSVDYNYGLVIGLVSARCVEGVGPNGSEKSFKITNFNKNISSEMIANAMDKLSEDLKANKDINISGRDDRTKLDDYINTIKSGK